MNDSAAKKTPLPALRPFGTFPDLDTPFDRRSLAACAQRHMR